MGGFDVMKISMLLDCMIAVDGSPNTPFHVGNPCCSKGLVANKLQGYSTQSYRYASNMVEGTI
jgi:hypothetical protein